MPQSTKKLLFVALGVLGWILFLVEATTSSDGYQFESKQFEQAEIELSVRVFADLEELAAAAVRVGLPEHTDAFASVYDSGRRCTIHLLDPAANPWEPATVGHEIAHCIWGDYHPSQKRAEDRATHDVRAAPETE